MTQTCTTLVQNIKRQLALKNNTEARKTAYASFNQARHAMFEKQGPNWVGKSAFFAEPVPHITNETWDSINVDNLTSEMVDQLCLARANPDGAQWSGTVPWSGKRGGYHVAMYQNKMQQSLLAQDRQQGYTMDGYGAYFPSPYAQEYNPTTQKFETVTPEAFKAHNPNLIEGKDWQVQEVRGKKVVFILNHDSRQCPPFQCGVTINVPVMKMENGQLILSQEELETVSSARVKKRHVRRSDGVIVATCKPSSAHNWMTQQGADAAASMLGYAPLSQAEFDVLTETARSYTLRKYGKSHTVPYKVVVHNGRTLVVVLQRDAQRGVLPPLSVAH